MAIKKKKDKNYSKIEIDLTGPDGNAFFLLGYGSKLVKEINRANGEDVLNWDEIRAQMTSGDYENLISVFDKYFGEYVDLYR